MPDVAPEPAPRPAREPHQYRQVAESFGGDAPRYDRTRPPYPAGLVERIVTTIPGQAVLDVGCGTGIEARQFQAAGCTVLGVEPDARMAEFARQTGVETEVATFEAWDPAGRSFDAVIAGTSWHWVDPVAGAVKAAQVLRPGGRLAPFHHVFQSPPEVAEALASAFQQAAPDSPFNSSARMPFSMEGQKTASALALYEPLFVKIADSIRATGAFTEPERWQFDWECRYTRDQWLDQLPTLGALTQLPPDKQAIVLASAGAAIDTLGGSFRMSYSTVAITAART